MYTTQEVMGILHVTRQRVFQLARSGIIKPANGQSYKSRQTHLWEPQSVHDYANTRGYKAMMHQLMERVSALESQI